MQSHPARAQKGTPHSQFLWLPSCSLDLSFKLCVLSEVRWDNGAWAGSLESPGASLPPWPVGCLPPWPCAPSAAGPPPRSQAGSQEGRAGSRARSCVVTSLRFPSALEGLHSSCEYPCARGSVALNSKLKTKQTKQNSNTKGPERNCGKKRKSSLPPFFNQEVPHFHFALGSSN